MGSNPASNGPVSVMCCGCYRIMGHLGNPIGPKPGCGIVNWSDAASFTNAAEADRAAADFGWQVKDANGPNHRCPECLAKPKTERRGAYVLWGSKDGVQKITAHPKATEQSTQDQPTTEGTTIEP